MGTIWYQTSDRDRVIIAVNPNAGARSGRPLSEQLARRLEAMGFHVETLSDIAEIAARSDRLQQNGELRAVVAAGGDGTAGLLANRVPAGVPLAMLPLGTENLLAKYLGVTTDPESVAETIRGGATMPLDAGRAGQQVFLLMASCGFDAEVVRRLHDGRHGHIHHFSYAKPILDSIRSYGYPELRIYCDDEPPIAARWAFVFNLPCYALGLKIAPDAVGTDGLLDVCTFKKGSLWNGLKYLGGIVAGRHQTWDDCQTRQVRRVRIQSAADVPYELDGDPGGKLPLDIEILADRLTLLVPERWAAKHRHEFAHNTD